MRVILGSAKGKKLATVKGTGIRPTADKVKMALFNVLQHGVINFNFEGCNTLDMFSGSGSLGIESLSRGSEFCFFLDISHESHQICKKNLQNCGLSDLSAHLLMDIRRKKPFFIEKKFDLILADPPYGKEYLVNILEFVTRNDLLKSDGVLVIEDDIRAELKLDNNFKLIEKKNYNKTQLIFLIPN